MLELVEKSLDDDKARDVAVICLAGKTYIADFLVVASGTSQRQIGAMTEHLRERLKKGGLERVSVEGLPQCDWVLIDAGDVIVHLFRPEIRAFYNLEKMWSGPRPEPGSPPDGAPGMNEGISGAMPGAMPGEMPGGMTA